MENVPSVNGVPKRGYKGVEITRWALYVLVFLLPILFLPWTTNVLEGNKQTLLVILTAFTLVYWLGSMVYKKRVEFRKGWLNVFPLLFLVGVLISSFLSLSVFQTWVGQATQEYSSFLTIATFVLLFYALANTASETVVQRNILFALFLSASISGLITLFGMLDLVHLPFEFAQSKGFNTIGTLNGYTTFLTIVSFLGLASLLVSREGKEQVLPAGKKGRFSIVMIIFISLLSLFTAAAIDFWVFWALNIAGVVLLVVFHFIQTKAFPNPKRFLLPFLVLVVSIIFLIFTSPIKLDLPVVVSPSYQLSWHVVKSTLSDNTSTLLLGSGPGTFAFDYARYKPVEVNSSPFWNVRFDRGKSFLFTVIATLGVVGAALWVLMIVAFALKALGALVKSRGDEEWKMTYVIFTGWSVAVLMHLLYSSNFTLHFMFWLLTGLLASQLMTKVYRADFKQAPRLGLALSFAFVLVSVGVLLTVFVAGQRYQSEITFASAVSLDRSGAPIQEVIEKIDRAASGYIGSQSDIYHRNLSSALLLQAREIIAAAEGRELSQEELNVVRDLVIESINEAERATNVAPNEVANWVVRGAIYRDVMSFAPGAEDFAAATFERAIALEPLNPSHHTNLGRIHLAVANRARALKGAESEELAQAAVQAEIVELAAAEESFTNAIRLKPDYAPAHFYIASTFERQGRLEDAAVRMAALRNVNQTDVGLAFQLSLLLLRLGEYDLARQELERIVSLAPNYSNALWFLASAYEIQGDQQRATAAVERVFQLNPENQLVKLRLNRMRSGQITTLLPEDLRAPVEAGEEGATAVPEGEVVDEGVDGGTEAMTGGAAEDAMDEEGGAEEASE